MQMTDGATYAPVRTEDPPGTTLTRSAGANFRAGKVSLSTKERHSPLLICASSPSRNPSRIPCLTQTFTSHRPSFFSAARISPLVRASRNSAKVVRALWSPGAVGRLTSLSISSRIALIGNESISNDAVPVLSCGSGTYLKQSNNLPCKNFLVQQILSASSQSFNSIIVPLGLCSGGTEGMNRRSGAGQVNPAVVTATVQSVITNRQSELKAVETSIPASLPTVRPSTADYAVADLFGRCFLRVCYWVDVFTSMTRRGEPLPYVPFTHQPVRSLASTTAEGLIQADSTEQALGATPIANA